MSFEKRILDILLFVIVVGLITAGIVAIGVNYGHIGNDSTVLVVKTLPSIRPVPKAKYIPVPAKTTPKASISNSILTPKAKQPVVINI